MRGHILFLVAVITFLVYVSPLLSLFIMGSDAEHDIDVPGRIIKYLQHKGLSFEVSFSIVKFFFYSLIFFTSLFSFVYSLGTKNLKLGIGNVILLIIWVWLILFGP